MKKTMLVFLFLALIVLLGLAVYVYVTIFVLGSGIWQQAYPDACCTQQNFQFEQSGRIGPGMMGPGMMRTTGAFINSEYEFLVHMIPHHEEAIFTASILKESTEREEMKQFAEAIISTQSYEAEQMTTWLASWYPDEKDHDIDYQPMMRNLEGLQGEELDRAFLEDMIPHHMEAIMMSQQLLSRGLAEHEEVAFLARDIRNNQRDEIHMMSNWMSRWYDNGSIAATNYGTILLWVGLIALAVLIVLAVWLIRVGSSGSTLKVSSVKSAKELLDIRYVKGEISQEEYRNTRKNLES